MEDYSAAQVRQRKADMKPTRCKTPLPGCQGGHPMTSKPNHLDSILRPSPSGWRLGRLALGLKLAFALALTATFAHSAEEHEHGSSAKAKTAAAPMAEVTERIRQGVERNNKGGKETGSTVIEIKVPQAPIVRAPGALHNPVDARKMATEKLTSREELRARAAAMAAESEAAMHKAEPHGPPHWEYEGEAGPATWGKLDPGFSTCGLGRRQSPIHIMDSDTLVGPAEPLQLNYLPTTGSVVNTGHSLQVDLDPSNPNTMTVRGSVYQLIQFHFHHPAEEKVNYKGFSMVAHLVHRNSENQLAVLAILIDPGQANSLINRVWTYLPLDTQDRVKMPPGSIKLTDLLPADLRYYQFMGSLTTPPCTEGVLWMVLKTPVTVSDDQLRLFSKLFPNNARPTQPLNGRVVRDAR
jgi:carbonic anhydrase